MKPSAQCGAFFHLDFVYCTHISSKGSTVMNMLQTGQKKRHYTVHGDTVSSCPQPCWLWLSGFVDNFASRTKWQHHHHPNKRNFAVCFQWGGRKTVCSAVRPDNTVNIFQPRNLLQSTADLKSRKVDFERIARSRSAKGEETYGSIDKGLLVVIHTRLPIRK